MATELKASYDDKDTPPATPVSDLSFQESLETILTPMGRVFTPVGKVLVNGVEMNGSNGKSPVCVGLTSTPELTSVMNQRKRKFEEIEEHSNGSDEGSDYSDFELIV